MLQAFGRELWLADGPSVRFLGLIRYPTRMAVGRLSDGALWVWSPVALDDALASEVDALGPVKHLVSPNKLHHLFLGEWAERYPQARLYASPGLAQKRPDLHFHAELGDQPDPSWGDDVDLAAFRGSAFVEEFVFFHRPSRTVLVCDLVQRFAPGQVGGLTEVFMRLWGLVGENGTTPLEWRLSFYPRAPARAARRKALAWNPERLVVAHGMCAAENGRDVLDNGLRWLR